MEYKEVKKLKEEEINKIVLHLNNGEQIVIPKGIVITTRKDNGSVLLDMDCCEISGQEFYDSIQGIIGLIVKTVGSRAVIELAKYFSNENTTSDIKISGTKYNEDSENC